MKLAISLATAFVALTFVPLASAEVAPPDLEQGPCIIYPWTYQVGGYWVGTGDYYVDGRSVRVGPFTVTQDPITVYGAWIYVPYGTTVTTPGVCYGSARDLVGELVTLA